jgi:hypothetical protein
MEASASDLQRGSHQCDASWDLGPLLTIRTNADPGLSG